MITVSYQYLDLPRGLLPVCIPLKTLIPSPIPATCPAQQNLLGLVILKGRNYQVPPCYAFSCYTYLFCLLQEMQPVPRGEAHVPLWHGQQDVQLTVQARLP